MEWGQGVPSNPSIELYKRSQTRRFIFETGLGRYSCTSSIHSLATEGFSIIYSRISFDHCDLDHYHSRARGG